MAVASLHRLRIEGMDCPSCALKIETAMRRLPGVSDVGLSYPAGVLTLKVDADRTSTAAIEDRVRALGYSLAEPQPAEPGSVVDTGQQVWWRDGKLRPILLTGGLLVLAFVLANVLPAVGGRFYAAAALLSVVPIARRALAGAVSGSPFTIETLMTVAVLGAVIIGDAEEAAVVLVLFAIGEWLETLAAGRARAGIAALIDTVPATARRRRAGSNEVEEVAAADLVPGDIVLVRPGDRIPSDGKVLSGQSEVSEAAITGESVPVAKSAGASVYAGSINTNGALDVEIVRAAADNTIARIIRLVEEAQEAKSPMARMIDEFSRWYTPAAMLAASLIVVVPPLVFGGDWMTWVYRGLATLLIACPCALVISTPAAIASGLAAGARAGLLIKGGAALETLGKVKTVAFDKTGTLTQGKPVVTDILALVGDETAVLARAAAVEAGTSHPLGQAIAEAARGCGVQPVATFGGSRAIPGKAMTARLKGGFVAVGSPRYAADQTALPQATADAIASLEAEGKTVVVLLAGSVVEGVIALRDEPREDAAAAIERLANLGVASVMLTGDNARTAHATAARLGMKARAELLPDDKLAEIARLKQAGPVAMVGDGINDAPALAAASVGIAMGGGTDVALETADAALLSNRVGGVAAVIELSRATIGNIHQNIAIALGLKAIFLATTLAGLSTLWMAILADTGATVLVTVNALRLLRWRDA